MGAEKALPNTLFFSGVVVGAFELVTAFLREDVVLEAKLVVFRSIEGGACCEVVVVVVVETVGFWVATRREWTGDDVVVAILDGELRLELRAVLLRGDDISGIELEPAVRCWSCI